jgi:V-type H+-transporting ATPase subunit a
LFCQIWNIFFAGRYIILLMGVFSVYTGIIYNDVFSRSLNIFGSQWTIHGYTIADIQGNAELTLSPYTNFASFNATPYAVGLDPVWQVTLIRALLGFLRAVLLKIQLFVCVCVCVCV